MEIEPEATLISTTQWTDPTNSERQREQVNNGLNTKAQLQIQPTIN